MAVTKIVSAGCCVAVLMATLPCAASAADQAQRCGLWVDLCRGEPLPYEELLEDLAGVRVIYLGECHTLLRHHEIQLRIFRDLAERGLPLALGLEQLDTSQQPVLEQYNRGQIDFDQLAQSTQWAKRWPNCQQYRPILDAANKARAPVLALNAKSETIRGIVRAGGVQGLAAKVRAELPVDLQLSDPLYEKVLGLQLMVHASASPQMLRPMIEAQIARDETMAATLAGFLQSKPGQRRTVVVLCGAGHVAYGLGTPARV